MTDATVAARLRPALLCLRLAVGLVFLVWVADKFANPGHTARVFEHFYGLSGLGSTAAAVLGTLQGLVVLAMLAGWRKTLSYGAVLLMHAASTLSSWQQYLDPFNNLLFFAAWPMLAACWALFALRDQDTLLSVDGRAPG